MYKQYRPYQYLLIFLDAVIVIGVLVSMAHLRPYLPGKAVMTTGLTITGVDLWLIALVAAFLYIMVFGMTGVYQLSRVPFFSLQVARLTLSYLPAMLVFAGVLYFSYREVSRLLVLYFAATTYGGLTLVRYLVHWYLSHRARLARTNVLVVGCTDNSVSVAQRLLTQYRFMYNLVGFVDTGVHFGRSLPAPLVGTIEDLPRLVREHNVELVLVAQPEGMHREVEQLILDLYPLPVRIYLIPDVVQLTLRHSEVESFAGLSVIGIREPAIQGLRRAMKRTSDIVISGVALVFSLPVFAAIWLAIKLDSKGPALYKTDRIGENGRIFTMLKFRTMVVGAEALQDKVTVLDKEGRPVYKVAEDPRITRVGKWLRRWSLDELPQLINIFKGDMSLVGPRPEQVFIAQEYDVSQWPRLAVPPGLTGWWQISGRSDLPLHLNTQYDLYYIRNYSLRLDLEIMWKTIGIVIRGRGAY
jgi:exopolysaccharide biosynthesis polyprenyl glycosylphosphotransferase